MATIYEPKFLQPWNVSVDMSVNQTFTAVMQGVKVTDYQLKIYNNDTGALLYDSTKLTLNPVLYNNQTLLHTVPANSVGTVRNLKWTLSIWNGSETVTSREKFFNNYSKPTLSLSPATINTQTYTFIATYSQAQNIPPKQFKYTLFNSNQSEISNSDWQFNGSVVWTFDGFISGNIYYVRIETYDIYNVYTVSGDVEFNVSYTQPSALLAPTVENLYEDSGIKIVFSGVFDNVGSSAGTIAYVDDYHNPTGKALSLASGATAMWNNLKIQDVFTDIFAWKPPATNFTGRIKRIENTSTGKYFEIGYDGNKFYYNINGIIQYTIPIVLDTNKWYLMIVLNNRIVVKPSN